MTLSTYRNYRTILAMIVVLLVASVFAAAQKQKKTGPCADPQTQAEMNICAGEEYKTADAALNQAYQKLNAMLDDEEKVQLKNAENAWIKYRDLHCDFVGDQYKGGSMRPMIVGLCLADVTRNRTTEIKNQIKDRNQ